MRKLLTVVGARPQFVKAAMVSHAITKASDLDEVLIHTGQHYDYGMSQAFFDQLDIPQPRVNLGISGGSHAQMTARMMASLEETMLGEAPDAVLLYGDTNSTLAAALVAAKLHIPVVHVEAGARTRSLTNPEEVNRICADHISSLLLTCTEANLRNLALENLAERAAFAGDPMYDAFSCYSARAQRPALVELGDGSSVDVPEAFYYLTCHREQNTVEEKSLQGILEAMQSLDAPVVYPVHPRSKAAVMAFVARGDFDNILPVEPVGYLESIWLVTHARQVVTDSGGLQREAFFAAVKCTTVLNFEVWPETMVAGRNILAKPNKDSILEAMGVEQVVDEAYQPFGNARAANNIVDHIVEFLEVR